MIKRIILVLAFMYLHFVSTGQIKFTNPGFEDTPHSNSPPKGWDSCAETPDCVGYNSQYPWYIPAYQGKTYLGVQFQIGPPPPPYESAGQFMNCNLIANKSHHFTLYAYEVSYVRLGFLSPGGKVQFWAGFGKCDLDTMLWQSPVLDTVWNQYAVEFTPNKSYKYVTFIPYNINGNDMNGGHCYIGIDDLSDITVEGGDNFLSTTFTDTVIKKYSCITLGASSDDTTATYKWSSVPAGFNDTGKTISVCPLINTQYICTATYGCGYQRYDTVNVEVTPSGIIDVQGGEYLSIYPNPAQNELTIDIANNLTPQQITVINNLGRVVLSVTPHKPKTALNISTLAAGLYFIKTQLSNGGVQVNKFVKQ